MTEQGDRSALVGGLTREEAVARLRAGYPLHAGTAACAACGSASTRPFLWQDGFRIAECDECGFLWVDPMPSEADMAAYYNSRSFRPYTPQECARKYAPTVRAVAAEVPKGSSVLDVGCGYGDFAARLRTRGYDVHGLDIHEEMVARAAERYGLPVHAGDLRTTRLDRDFDAVTILSSLEHMTDPYSVLRAARAVLRPGGLLLVSTPRGDGLLSRVSRTFFLPTLRAWEFFGPPSHLAYFTRTSLSAMLTRAGFAVRGFHDQARDGAYKRRELDSLLRSNPRGAPVARRVYPLLRHLRPIAKAIGAGDMMICVAQRPAGDSRPPTILGSDRSDR